MPAKNSRSKTPAPAVPRYQIKITLTGSGPSIWRRLVVRKDLPLDLLSDVIQIAMGWEGCHLHQFITGTTRATRVFYGVADPDFGPVDEDILDERDYTLAQLAPAAKRKFRYEYDFGDGWEHEVVVEKTLPPDPAFKYSVCLAGENACPPEDCGGIGGFYRLLEALADPEDPEHEEMQGWVEADWNPAAFDCERVNAGLKKFKA